MHLQLMTSYIVENYPKRVDTLPKNLPERPNIITMSKAITRYLSYIEELYQLIENSIDLTNVDQKRLKKIRRKYKSLKLERVAEIRDLSHYS